MGDCYFRLLVKHIDVPSLVIHGTADRIVPFAVSGKRMPELVKDCKVWPVEGAPRGLNWTAPAKSNSGPVHLLGGPPA